jgi:3-methyladenine DNA glycosylase AlkD
MSNISKSSNVDSTAEAILSELQALGDRSTPNERRLRRRYSKLLKDVEPQFMLELVLKLNSQLDSRGFSYELFAYHKPSFQSLGPEEVAALGQGINSWWTVDAFGRIISGPAWLQDQIEDVLIHSWAHSPDRWWRRAALVSTVALNSRSQGGFGDSEKTLAVCDLLLSDYDDMVVKAMSWAIRELAGHNPDDVRAYLQTHENVLAARVKREVRNKLETGLKNPKRGR